MTWIKRVARRRMERHERLAKIAFRQRMRIRLDLDQGAIRRRA